MSGITGLLSAVGWLALAENGFGAGLEVAATWRLVWCSTGDFMVIPSRLSSSDSLVRVLLLDPSVARLECLGENLNGDDVDSVKMPLTLSA